MIDRVEHAAGLLGRGAEHDGRLSAVGADLDADAVAKVGDRRVVQRAAFVGGHEADDLRGEFEQVRGGGGRAVSVVLMTANLPLLVRYEL